MKTPVDMERLTSLFRRTRMVRGMIEPTDREEYGNPGRRKWSDIDDAWLILLEVDREYAELVEGIDR